MDNEKYDANQQGEGRGQRDVGRNQISSKYLKLVISAHFLSEGRLMKGAVKKTILKCKKKY